MNGEAQDILVKYIHWKNSEAFFFANIFSFNNFVICVNFSCRFFFQSSVELFNSFSLASAFFLLLANFPVKLKHATLHIFLKVFFFNFVKSSICSKTFHFVEFFQKFTKLFLTMSIKPESYINGMQQSTLFIFYP